MKNIMFFVLAILLSSRVVAQETPVTGVILDDKNGAPIIGASVLVKGTSVGTVSDLDGNFKIVPPAGKKVLVISSIGYKTQEVQAKPGQILKVTLEENTEVLDEVVVVGYGSMKKTDLTGSVASLSGDKLKESIVTNVDQMLQGRVAGVQVATNSGAPGAATSIRIRGASSINNTNEPLYIIDGIPMSGAGTTTAGFDWTGGSNGQNQVNPLASIAPSDIVSMDVLKDASATAIYGAAGANGVVIITTKRGKSGKANITYDGYVALQQRTGKLDMMNLREFAQYQKSLYDEGVMYNVDQAYLDPSLLGTGTDWQDEVTKDALMHSHNVSLTGGTDKTQYAASIGYTGQDGIMLTSEFERFTGRLNIDNEFNKYVKVGRLVHLQPRGLDQRPNQHRFARTLHG